MEFVNRRQQIIRGKLERDSTNANNIIIKLFNINKVKTNYHILHLTTKKKFFKDRETVVNIY